ncbi:baculoviral IAP repeat-containing protein 7 isoform X2 [Peromyscus californicus insignis]|uniref:baculoviral IAP repeat-containing protein 7 isoform X2 n=1 Tax=Peromyscus californicus insignis TaxID=564181 RepID=UPI0022A747DE|nr:baculoviral IAP repeat-containing protein 7 isoform X2 [Peromyscus californicus insignis]
MFSPADLLRAAVLSMGPEGRARDLFCGPELSHREASNGPTQEQCGPHRARSHVLVQDCLDGQILGQLRTLSEEEDSSGATFLGEPAFPEMDSEDLRLASFYDWPSTAGIQPEPLAAAGFFHTGQQDKVRCFFCYGGLQSWEHGDDPWTEHARWFPRCRFLLQSKGRDFVERIQACTPLLSSWVSPSVLRTQVGWQSLLCLLMALMAFQQDQWEEPEDTVPATPSDTRGNQSQSPGVPSTPASQLMADLLQENEGQMARARAPAHGGPESLTSRRQTQPEDASEPVPRSWRCAGTAATAAGGENMQGVPGSGCICSLRALWPLSLY